MLIPSVRPKKLNINHMLFSKKEKRKLLPLINPKPLISATAGNALVYKIMFSVVDKNIVLIGVAVHEL